MIHPAKMVSQEDSRKPQNPPATDHGRSTVLQVPVSARLLRLCARFHTGSSRAIEFCRILTHEEIRKLLQAVDALEPTAHSPLRHLIMPEVFRLLYGCGFRLGEVLNLGVRDVDLDQGIVTVRQGKFRKDRLVPLALSLVNRLWKYAARFENRPLDRIFLPAPNGGPSAYGPFTAYFVNCYLSVALLTREEARDPGSTIFVTHSQSTPCCVGIETVRISTPNFPFWPPTWAISTFRERSAIFISPRNFFLRSQRESTRSLVRSFRGGSSHETDRFLRSRDDLFDPLPGRTAQCEPQYDQGLPRRVYSPAAILPRR